MLFTTEVFTRLEDGDAGITTCECGEHYLSTMEQHWGLDEESDAYAGTLWSDPCPLCGLVKGLELEYYMS